MLFEGSIQETLAAAALRRQPVLVAVVDQEEGLDAVTKASVHGSAFLHVIRNGSPEQTQFDSLCPNREIPRVHVFPPAARGLPPTVLAKEHLTSEMVLRAVTMSNEFTKDEVNNTLKWAQENKGDIERQKKQHQDTLAFHPSSPVAKQQQQASTPSPDKKAAAAAAKIPVGSTDLVVQVADDGTKVTVHGIHAKASLSAVRKKLEQEHASSLVSDEYFHFVICKGDTCRRILHKNEDEDTLVELGLFGAEGATLKLGNDATAKPKAGMITGEEEAELHHELIHPHASAEHPNQPFSGQPIPTVILPDGTKKKLPGLHSKTTLQQVRKRIVDDQLVDTEFFHFIVCTGETSCRKILLKKEDELNLSELDLLPGGKSTLKVNSDADSGLEKKQPPPPQTLSSSSSSALGTQQQATKKKVTFVHPVTQEIETVEVSSATNLAIVWDSLNEPSGNLMFLPAAKKKLTRAEASGQQADVLFGETKVMLLNSVAQQQGGGGGGSPLSSAPPAETTPPTATTTTMAAQQPKEKQQGDIDYHLKVILPAGATLDVTINASQPLSAVLDQVAAAEGQAIADECVLQLAYPPRRFTEDDMQTPIAALKVGNNSVIRASRRPGGSGGSSAPQQAGGFFSRMTQYIPGLGFGLGGSGGGGGEGDSSHSSQPQHQSQRGGHHSMRELRREQEDEETRRHSSDPDKKKKYYDGNSTEYQEHDE